MTLNLGRCLVKLTCSNAHSTKCLYSRWTHRRPSRVLLQSSNNLLKHEEIIELDPKTVRIATDDPINNSVKAKINKSKSLILSNDTKPEPKDHFVENSSVESQKALPPAVDGEKIKKRRSEAIKQSKESLSKKSVFDEQGELVFYKLKQNDGRVSKILTTLKSKNGRSQTNRVLVEGRRLIVDGLQANCKLEYLIFSRASDLDHIKPHLPRYGVQLFKIPYKEISLWSSVDTSPGLLGVFEMPKLENILRSEKPLPLQIICDNIRDPGNLGAVLRASVGVGCRNVFLMKGCVDYWDSKVIRSAAGAHFRLPIHSSLEWPQVCKLVQPNSSVLIADNNFKVEIREMTPETEDMESLDSLNVPVVPYYSMDYSSLDSITLIVGGETEGISEDSYRFAAERNGMRVNIPLESGVDSLNTGMATAVIAFEIKKQILEASALKKTAAQ